MRLVINAIMKDNMQLVIILRTAGAERIAIMKLAKDVFYVAVHRIASNSRGHVEVARLRSWPEFTALPRAMRFWFGPFRKS